jgi:hypothetical protein
MMGTVTWQVEQGLAERGELESPASGIAESRCWLVDRRLVEYDERERDRWSVTDGE